MNGLGDRIRTLRTRRSIPQQHLADSLGVSRSAIAMWESGQREPSLDMLLKIASALHTPPEQLLSDAPEFSLQPVQSQKVPLLSTCEPLPPLESAPQIDPMNAGCDFALLITDDSMSPTLIPGDTVLLRRGEPDTDGKIVALLIDGRIALKRLYRTPSGSMLLSDNPRHAPLSPTDLPILGTAVACRRPL